MNVNPSYIRDNINQFTSKEASRILREWIENSNDHYLRKDALELLFSVDDGNNFDFYEQLFLSEENLDIRFLAGDLIARNYFEHKKLLDLLQYTLEKVEIIDQKFLALELLNSMRKNKAIKIMRSYVKKFYKMEVYNKIVNLMEIFNSSIQQKQVSDNTLQLIFNLCLYQFYTKICNYHISIDKGFIILLNCEGHEIQKIMDIQGLNKLNRLEHLILRRNQISEINNLDYLENLKILDLSYNNITIIENINHLKSLRELNLSHNKINEISNLRDLISLEKLYLNSNKIKCIKNIDKLEQLKLLNLNEN